METLTLENVESRLLQIISDFREKLNIEANIDHNSRPGNIGFTSIILVTLVGRLGKKLDVDIPHDCYLFYDKDKKKQLSIREAASKLLKISSNG